jgi:multiple sugar transport system permease protein
MSKTSRNLLIYGLLILWSLVALGPFVWMILSSFKPIAEVLTWPPRLFPQNVTVDNYVKAWTLVPYGRYMLNSTIITGLATLGVVCTSTMAAYSLSFLQVPGSHLIMALILLGLIVPAQTGFIPVFMMVRRLGLIDTYPGVILPYLGSAFGVFLLSQFFKLIPFELADAARIDGLGEFGIIRHVVMPLGKPGITTLIIFNFMGVWRDFFWPFLLINKEELRTVPLGVVAFWQAESQHWGQILAAATISMLPLVLVFVLFQKQFVRGISWSGLKM